MRLTSALTTLTTLLVTSVSAACSSGLQDLPLPAPHLSTETYTLHAEFANALNLPTKAKVKLAGADIGELESMTARNYIAHITFQIRSDIRLTVGTTAELRSATPLGDVFIALSSPPENLTSSDRWLHDGDTISLESTKSAATVEAVLSSAAVLVNGGAIRNMTKLANGLGDATGNRGESLQRVIGKSNQLLAKMNSRAQQFQESLAETNTLAASLAANRDQISDILQAAAPGTEALASDANNISDLVAQLSGITRQAARFPSVQGTDSRSIVTDLNTTAKAFNGLATHPDPLLWSLNRLLPLVIKAASGTAVGGHLEIPKIALGAIPDIGYAGDPGFHGPKRADWDYLVGSLRYQLFRLQERVVGQGPDHP
ncbi:hypothetical protein BKG77_15805 [Mycobacteroides chelonae]|jgi:virulence factor Mce-like protein|uniref:MCE family protein n=1 Tax=Mycobacteroides chelonae TaxID=1774 RepID=UPI0008A8D94C|nr:MCE family protein [Mycobacteroides chelonae]OHU24873.1 hypothetical protein BKG77_15805 [Mycobacteroides chelonae]